MKAESKKIEKENSLLEAAFKLFTEKGIKNTSIQEIADEANVGKGTFYLYFKDKYDLQEQLIARKSYKLFNDAMAALNKQKIIDFGDQIIFVIDYVIDELTNNPTLLKIIAKDLSYGLYSEKMTKLLDDKVIGIKELFINKIKENNLKINNPDVILYMIIELTSSTCFSCIMKNKPIPINEYKPYLYKTIKKLLEL